MTMIRLRRITQIASLLAFMLLLIIAGLPGDAVPGLADIYPRMSPLLFVSTWLNAWAFPAAFLPAIAVLVLTVVLGRFFCGWICPLGVTLDATDKWLGPRGKRDDSREPLKWKSVKYALLIAVLLAAYFEAGLAGWVDPLSFATRLYALVALPAAEFAARLAFEGLRPVPGLGWVAGELYSFFRTGLFAAAQPQFHGMLAVFLMYLGVALLVWFNRRFWCRFLCPAGALFAIASRFSLVRRVVDPGKCIHCNKCVRSCRTGAIIEGGEQGFRGECIECFTCVSVCPTHAVSFRMSGARAQTEPVNAGRRQVMAGMAGAAAAVPLLRVAPGGAETALVRPPGVADPDLFLAECLRCGECMRACPTNAIQPVWFQDTLENLWTPHLATRVGYCDWACNKCGRVCPSHAIKELALEVKQRTVLGRAVFDHNRCIPWSRGENCAVCEEHCPVPEKAIHLREEKMLDDHLTEITVMVPFVREDHCIGCGSCEAVCPVEGRAGVRVTGVAQHVLEPKQHGRGLGGIVLSSLLPASPPAPWQADGEPRTAGPDDLFVLINGEADVYIKHGYRRALHQTYSDPFAPDTYYMDVELYLMANGQAAKGIYAEKAPSGGESADAGDTASYTQGQLLVRIGPLFMILKGEASRDDFLAMARALEANVPKAH